MPKSVSTEPDAAAAGRNAASARSADTGGASGSELPKPTVGREGKRPIRNLLGDFSEQTGAQFG